MQKIIALGAILACLASPAMAEDVGQKPPLQLRIIPVAATADEQQPDLHQDHVTQFAKADDLTLIAEVKNVSDAPVSLLGVRYGNSVTPPWPGKSVSDEFAPHVFACEFFDRLGKPLALPARNMLDGDVMLTLSSGLAETIEPGKSLVVLLRPVKWNAAIAQRLTAGEYLVRVHYRGPSPGVVKELQAVWPDKPVSKVWSGDIVAEPVTFRVTGPPPSDVPPKPRELAFGPIESGLQAAVEFRSADDSAQAQRDTASNTFPHRRIHVRSHMVKAGRYGRAERRATCRVIGRFVARSCDRN